MNLNFMCKVFFFLTLVVSTWSSTLSFAAEAGKPNMGPIIEVIKKGFVYTKPDTDSKVVAELNIGTSLLLKKVSPKGFWLQLEDDEGNAGWMLTDNTNYGKVNAKPVPQDMKPKDSWAEEKPKPEEELDHSNARTTKFVNVIEVFGRTNFSGFSNMAFGTSYSAMIRNSKMFFLRGRLMQGREHYFGLKVGLFREGELNMFFRPKMLSRAQDTNWAHGPDLNFSLGLDTSAKAWGVGYTLAWLPTNPLGITVQLRTGIDFVSGNPFNVELSTGVMF